MGQITQPKGSSDLIFRTLQISLLQRIDFDLLQAVEVKQLADSRNRECHLPSNCQYCHGSVFGLMAAEAMNVLIVEDNQLLRWCISNCLQQGGFAVTAVNSVEEAIQLNGSLKPDVLITDMRLGGGTNGFEVLQEIRKRFPGTPALLVSAEADADLIARAQAAGFDKVIEKPCEMAHVVAEVRSAICPLDGSFRDDSVKGGESYDNKTVSGLRQTAGSNG